MKKNTYIQYISAFLFTFCGGFCDAYTYIFRGGVFANMQTGNLVKFCIAVTGGKFEYVFLLPMLFFCLGSIISTWLNAKKDRGNLILILLFCTYFGSGFFPNTEAWNLVCICLLSVAGAMQFQSFRNCLSTTYTSTMCTNNMRLFSEGIVGFFVDKKDKRFLFYFVIIVCFSLGCAVSALLGKVLDLYTVSPLASLYAVIFLLRLNLKADEA